jgi:D-glycero-alpha-D-manno-heptose-7-phosphate kinase
VNAAIDQPVTVAVVSQVEPGVRVSVNGRLASKSRSGFPAIVAAAMAELGMLGGMRVDLRTAVPLGAGLGSSGAFSVALVATLLELSGLRRSPDALADLAVTVERMTGAVVGRQDHWAATHGGVNQYEFHSDSVTRTTIPLAASELERPLVIAHPGGTRRSSIVVAAVLDAYRRGDPRVGSALVRLNLLAREVRPVLLARDFSLLTEVVGETMQRQLELHPDIAGPRTLSLWTRLRSQRLGDSKLLGGGGPAGASLVVCRPEARTKVEALADELDFRVIPVHLSSRGVVTKAAGHEMGALA